MSSHNDDFLFRGDLAKLDPAVAQLIELEKERQIRKLIMIPSERCLARCSLTFMPKGTPTPKAAG
jgi:hypothetical protein